MFRLKQYKQGWIVEKLTYKRRFFFLVKKWVHVTHYAGLEHQPFYYSTPEAARDGALDKLKDDMNFSFYHPEFYK